MLLVDVVRDVDFVVDLVALTVDLQLFCLVLGVE